MSPVRLLLLFPVRTRGEIGGFEFDLSRRHRLNFFNELQRHHTSSFEKSDHRPLKKTQRQENLRDPVRENVIENSKRTRATNTNSIQRRASFGPSGWLYS